MDHKDIRKQIRNVLQEEGAGQAIKIAVEQCDKLITDKLAEIEKLCVSQIQANNEAVSAQLQQMDKRARAIQGYLVQQVKTELQKIVLDSEDKIDAAVEILAEVTAVPDFAARVATRQAEIRQRKEDEAAQIMKDRLEAERLKAEEAAPSAQQETPAAQA